MTEKKTGRPTKYTEAQVIKGIEIVERTGGSPTGDTVKKAMCDQLGVAGGINAQSLDKEVQRLLEEHKQQRRRRLIAALPPITHDAAKEIGSLVQAAVLNHMGEQHDKLRSLNGRKLTELNVDLCNQREQIRGLLSRIDTKDSEIAELEGEKHDLKGRLDLATAEIDALKERVTCIEREEDFQTKMLAMMKETLGQQAKTAD
jgi:chromosome segregation ATPase